MNLLSRMQMLGVNGESWLVVRSAEEAGEAPDRIVLDLHMPAPPVADTMHTAADPARAVSTQPPEPMQ